MTTTCPICGRVWEPTPVDDCFRPACGCYGDEIGPDTPCEGCGLKHAWTCSRIEGHERRAEQGVVKVYELAPGGATIARPALDLRERP